MSPSRVLAPTPDMMRSEMTSRVKFSAWSEHDGMRSDNDQCVLVVGDSHCNATWWRDVVVPAAIRVRPVAVVSGGDFGYWPGHSAGRAFLETVSAGAAESGTFVCFVDGNHEQHDALEQTGEMVEVSDRVFHTSRGARWTWGRVRFGALGGAVSPDRDARVEGWDWFREEALTDGDVGRLGDEPLDVLFTHDAPSWVDLAGIELLDPSVVGDMRRNRQRVDRAVSSTAPELVVHGHWHVAHRTTVDRPGRIEVVGLAGDIAATPVEALGLLYGDFVMAGSG